MVKQILARLCVVNSPKSRKHVRGEICSVVTIYPNSLETMKSIFSQVFRIKFVYLWIKWGPPWSKAALNSHIHESFFVFWKSYTKSKKTKIFKVHTIIRWVYIPDVYPQINSWEQVSPQMRPALRMPEYKLWKKKQRFSFGSVLLAIASQNLRFLRL